MTARPSTLREDVPIGDGVDTVIPRDVDNDRPSPPLRRIMLGLDAGALAVGWIAAEFVYNRGAGEAASPLLNVVLFTAVGVTAGLFLMAAAGLYRRRVCQVRSVEVARIARVAAAMSLLAGLRATGVGADTALIAGLVAAFTLLMLLSIERAILREWIAGRRAGGDYRAPVVVVGHGEAVHRAAEFLMENPILGFDVLGVAGPDVTSDGPVHSF
jgi:FlaA1/EpsC-like NDP-sugar epimerase